MSGLPNQKGLVDYEPLTPLVPIKSGSKEPFLKSWPTLSEEALNEAFEKHPESNVALRLDNYLALDPDNEEAVKFLDDLEEQGILPETVKYRTWSGHPNRLYKVVPDLGYREITRDGMELELRTGNGQVCVIPESEVDGKKYRWENDPADMEVAELPQEALRIILGPEEENQPKPAIRSADDPIPEGTRNSYLASIAGAMRRRGKGQEAIEAALMAENRSKCEPPLPEEEVATIAQSICRYDPDESALPHFRIMSAEEVLSSSNPEKIQEVIGKGILPEAGCLILCGPAEVGKSLLTLEMAVRLAYGMDLWGLPVAEAQNVLVIQAEIPQQYENARLLKILKGLELPVPPKLSFLQNEARFNLGSASHVRRLEEEIAKAKAKVVILDPLSSYHCKDENDNIAMRSILEGLSDISPRTGVAWIVVHHHGKPYQGGATNYRGASSIKDWGDTMIDMRAVKTSSDGTQVRLDFSKLRHGSKLPPLLLERDENLCHHPVEAGKVPPSMVAEALRKMGEEPQSKAALANCLMDRTNCGKSTAYSAIDKAVDTGVISASGRGKKRVYSLRQD
jgi:archaellum biogenesis ATPase FlaH